jgi:type VI secretion system secreted protein Hcp
MAIFLKVDGVDGDSKDDKHDKWIDLLSWGWGAHHSSDMQSGGGTSGGSAQVEQINVMCKTSSATAVLSQYCMKATKAATIEIHGTKAFGDEKDTWLELELKDATVSNVNQDHQSDPSGGDSSHTSITFSFEECKQEIYDQKKDQSRGASKIFTWIVGEGIE